MLLPLGAGLPDASAAVLEVELSYTAIVSGRARTSPQAHAAHLSGGNAWLGTIRPAALLGFVLCAHTPHKL